MNIHADKTKEDKKQSVANAGLQRDGNGNAVFQLVDNRPEAIIQMKLQEMANNSPQVKQAAQLQAIADNYSSQIQHPIQKKANTESSQSDNNTGLTDNLKTGIEHLSGISLDDVKVHRNSDKPAQLQAHAYAHGTNIYLGPRQEKYLPHEAWHVVQQKQGRVKPTMQLKGKVNGNDNIGLETEADIMGIKANQFVNNRSESNKLKVEGNHETVQRKVIVKNKEITPIVDEIKNEAAFKYCENSKGKVLIETGINSQTTPLTAHNKYEMEGVDVKITLKKEDLENGAKIDPQTTINADGQTHNDIPIVEDTGKVPIFDITGKYETIKKQIGTESIRIVPNDLSAATVLLHEMGHAVQYLKALPDHAKSQKSSKGKQLIEVPVLSKVNELSDDIKNAKIDSKNWSLRVFELSDMGMILKILKDLDVEGVAKVDALRLLVLDRIKIWMEHDVMINIEHPFAEKRKEGIRLRHGEELDQRQPEVLENKGGRLIRNELLDRTVKGKDKLNVKTAGDEMRKRLQLDSKGLPGDMAKLLDAYKSLEMPKDLLDQYVGDGFK